MNRENDKAHELPPMPSGSFNGTVVTVSWDVNYAKLTDPDGSSHLLPCERCGVVQWVGLEVVSVMCDRCASELAANCYSYRSGASPGKPDASAKPYSVTDSQTGKVVSRYATRKAALRSAERMNQQYGSVRYNGWSN